VIAPASPFLAWDGPLLDGSTWQGIEYLAIDTNVVGLAAVLTVHLARPAAGITESDVLVSGGAHAAPLPHQVSITDGDAFFRVEFPQRGDRSRYSISLLSGGSDPLHPFFSVGEFSFFIDCPAGDCREAPPPALPATKRALSIDTTKKDFRGFLQLLSEWIHVRNPRWSDVSEASFERVLLDLLAHQADHLSYYQDRVANEAFLETASQRFSLRQHATLLGYSVFDGQAATTTLAFSVQNDGYVPSALTVEQPAQAGDRPLAFTTTQRIAVSPANNWDTLTVAAWPGATTARIPSGASELLLWGHGNALEPGQRLAFAQGGDCQIVTLTEVARQHAPGWTQSPSDAPHAGLSAVTRIRWDEALRFSLHPWLGTPRLWLFANLVDAVHGRVETAWVEAPSSAPASEHRITLTPQNSIIGVQKLLDGERTQLRAVRLPELPVLFVRDGDERVPDVQVDVDGERWERVETLTSSRSFDHHYTATSDEDGSLWLRFGDGLRGADVRLVTLAARRAPASPHALGIEAIAPGPAGNEVRVTFAAAANGDPARFRIVVFYKPAGQPSVVQVEDFDGLSIVPNDSNFVMNVLQGSRYIRGYVDEGPLTSMPAPEPGLGPPPNAVGNELAVNAVQLVSEAPVSLRARYRVGDPTAGNCAPGTLTKVSTPPAGTTIAAEFAVLGAVQVNNVVPGRGGRQPETSEALRRAIPDSIRHGELQRAVALEDYANAAVAADTRVARAAAKALGGPFNTVFVLVDPAGQVPLDESLQRVVSQRLDHLRMAGREVHVVGPDYVPLDVELALCASPGFLPHEVRKRVFAALRPGEATNPGYFHPDRLSFGQDVALGDLSAFTQHIAGVHSVKVTRFRRLRDPSATLVFDRIAFGVTEVARLDANENLPHNGRLSVKVVGLDDVDTSSYDISSAQFGGAS